MAAAKTARIAFIGAGTHATESLYPNIPQIPEFELVAVCDLDANKAEYWARRYGARAFTEAQAMLDEVGPAGVCVVGPPEMHYEVGLQVLERGIPVFIEKPPAPTLAGAQELAEGARAAGTWGMVGFMKRFAPANVVAKEYMASGEFQRLSSITLIHSAGPYEDLRRMLMFNGIHMIDLSRYFGGEVVELFAYAFEAEPGLRTVSVALSFADGAVGQLNLNSGQHWRDCFEQVYISGAGAGILIDASRTVEVMAAGRRFAACDGLELYGWSGRYYVSGNMAGWAAGGHYTRGYWGELARFARAVAGLEPPAPTIEDGVAAMRLIDAIIESATTGRPLKV